MGCFAPSMQQPMGMATMLRKTTEAQTANAPGQYLAEQAYQPLYAGVTLDAMNTMLNGTTGGPQTINSMQTANQTGFYDAAGNFVKWGVKSMDAPPGTTFHKHGDKFSATHTLPTTGAPGLLELLQQQNTSQRQGDINDVANLGRQSYEAMLAADPANAQLLAKLNAQANEGLDAGSMLTADEQRAMQQQSRAAFASRGMGGSNPAIADELLRQFNLGQTLLRQRQQFAQGLIGTNRSVTGDPFQQILNRTSGAVPYAQQGLGQSGPSLFNPMAGQDYYSGVYNNQVQTALATPTTYQLIGQGFNTMANQVSAVGSIMGSSKCWVAREVLGERNLNWVLFRHWLENAGPRWLDRLYARHGERFAAWLKRHPWPKPVLKVLMWRAIKSNALEAV